MMDDLYDNTTMDAFLGGRLRLRQPRTGHRAGHDAILLAAATQPTARQLVVDFGAGVGTAGLAVARRTPGIDLCLVEIDERLSGLARINADANDIPAQVITLNVADQAAAFVAAGLFPDTADVVLMNPPYNDNVRHRGSPDDSRRLAHVAKTDTLQTWIHAARRLLRSGGELVLIWRADGIADVMAAVDRGFGSLSIIPIYADATSPAIRIIVRAVKGGRAAPDILPAIVLQDADGHPTPHIARVLSGDSGLISP